jgi:hypothetical protein
MANAEAGSHLERAIEAAARAGLPEVDVAPVRERLASLKVAG